MITDEQRRDCADSALHTHGWGYAYDQRYKKLKVWANWLTFMGFATPISVFGIIATFSLSDMVQSVVMAFAGVAGTIHLLLALWALVAKWDDNLELYRESKRDYDRLSVEYNALGRSTNFSPAEFQARYAVIDERNRARDDLVSKASLEDSEKRRGLRSALIQFQRVCVGCGKIPSSMESSDCNICGNF